LADLWRGFGRFLARLLHRPRSGRDGRPEERKEQEMKRMFGLVLAVAAIAVPTALAQSPIERINAQERARGNDPRVVGTLAPTRDPITQILAQERGRRLDPRLFATPAPAIQIVESGGFHWGDAGIGAATAAGLMLLALGTMLFVRSARVRSA
jgi:hypothetical protein